VTVVLLLIIAAAVTAAVTIRHVHVRHVARDEREAAEYRGYGQYGDPLNRGPRNEGGRS